MNSNAIISISYEIEYNNYKKRLIKQIFNQLDIIFNMFDEEFNENIVKVYIMLISNKIPIEIKRHIIFFYELINELNNIEHIDHYEFLNIIFLIVKIKRSLETIDNCIKKNGQITKYINWELIREKFLNCVKILSFNNRIIEILIRICETEIKLLKLNHENTKKNVIELANILSFDFFMYYSSSNMLKLLFRKMLLHTENIESIENSCSIILAKYKKYFINQYRIKYECYVDMYYDIKNSNVSKFKYNKKNIIFNELIKDILSVEQSSNK